MDILKINTHPFLLSGELGGGGLTLEMYIISVYDLYIEQDHDVNTRAIT